jgi:hypothetical protein
VSNEAKHVNNTASVPGVIPMKAPTTWALLRQHSPQPRQFRGGRDSSRSRSRQLISWVGSVLGQAARTAKQFDRSKISIPTAVRNTIGVAVTLILGIVCGHPLVGVTASIGALNAGFASFQGTYRSRAEVVLLAAPSVTWSGPTSLLRRFGDSPPACWWHSDRLRLLLDCNR